MLYPLAMGFTLMLGGEHYLVDVLAGWFTPVLAAIWVNRVAAAGVAMMLSASTTAGSGAGMDCAVSCCKTGRVCSSCNVSSSQSWAACSCSGVICSIAFAVVRRVLCCAMNPSISAIRPRRASVQMPVCMLSETAEMLAPAQSLCQRYGDCVSLSWGAAILADPVGVTDIFGAVVT